MFPHTVFILGFFATRVRIAMKRGCRTAVLLLVMYIAIFVAWHIWRANYYRFNPNGPGVSQDYIEEHDLPKDFNTPRYVLP